MITMVIMARPDNRNTRLSQVENLRRSIGRGEILFLAFRIGFFIGEDLQVAEQKLSGIRRLGMGPFVVP